MIKEVYFMFKQTKKKTAIILLTLVTLIDDLKYSNSYNLYWFISKQ